MDRNDKATQSNTAPDTLNTMCTRIIGIRARVAGDGPEIKKMNESGIIPLEITARAVSPTESQILRKLFPNTGDVIDRLMTIEAVLSRIVDDGAGW